MSLMKVSPARQPSLEKLACEVGLSPSRLRHLFKAEAGMSPTKYYRALRIHEAKELMETTFLTIKEIRARLGIRNKDQFTRDFKRLYGRTPAQHRAYKPLALPRASPDSHFNCQIAISATTRELISEHPGNNLAANKRDT